MIEILCNCPQFVDGERFKTRDIFTFQNSAFDNETPFKLQYLETEAFEADSPSSYETSSDIFKENLFKEDYYQISEDENQATAMMPDDMMLERQFETDTELALFSSETHEPEFSDFLADLASEAEESFINFTTNTGYGTQLEEVLEQPNFESKFDQFFESQYGSLVENINTGIDRLSNHIDQNLHSDMTLEQAQAALESFQVAVEPEQFLGLGNVLKKVKNVASNVIKKGIDIAKKVATGPLKAILAKIKPLIRPMLKQLLKKGMGLLPEKYRDLAQKALGSLGLDGELQGEASAEDVLRLEVIGSYETEAEGHDILHEGLDAEVEGESIDNELYGINEVEREFDRQVLSIAEAEMYGMANEDLTYETSEYGELTSIESEIVSLNRARDEFISGLTSGSADIGKLTQDFVPAVLPALKLGVRLVGRPKVVDFIADLVSRLLQGVVEKNLASPLSKALVDVGLRMVNLEVPEPMEREQYLASTATNIVTETVDRVSRLPVSILEGEDEVLQSFIQDSLLRSTANNVPPVLLNEDFVADRDLPADVSWIPRNGGKYKVLSKKFAITLDPSVAARLRTWRKAETLLDLLRNFQKWDGKTPVQAIVHVFEGTPATRRSMIAKDYLGGFGRREIRQIIPLGKSAATRLLKEPKLATPRPSRGSMAGRRFYLVQISKGTSTGIMQGSPTEAASSKGTSATNDINIKLISPDKLEVKVYLNGITTQRIKGIGETRVAVELYKEIESLVLPTGSKKVGELMSALNVPKAVAKEIVSLLVGWVVKNVKTNLASIVAKFSQITEKPEQGVTIIINVELPADFASSLAKLTVVTLGGFISKLLAVAPTVKIDMTPGNRL
jgi:hypothetical protein